MTETMTSRQRVLKGPESRGPRPGAHRSRRLPDGHPQEGLYRVCSTIWALRTMSRSWTRSSSSPSRAKRCLSDSTSTFRYLVAHGPESFRGGIERTSVTVGSGTISRTSSASSGRCPTTSSSTWISRTTRWPRRASRTWRLSLPQGRRSDAVHRAARARPSGCVRKRRTRSRLASGASSTKPAGTCAAWSDGSWTRSRTRPSARRCWIRPWRSGWATTRCSWPGG